jgi:hypothetical protein
MPPVIFAVVAAAGFFAAARMFAKAMEAQSEAMRQQMRDMEQRAQTAAGTPKDLGALDWDEGTGTYVPRETRH